MTDFTREDMRERIARRINDVDVPWSNYEEIADAIMDELGLWEMVQEAAFLCARLRELESSILDDAVGREYYGHVRPSRARLESNLASLRGETK